MAKEKKFFIGKSILNFEDFCPGFVKSFAIFW